NFTGATPVPAPVNATSKSVTGLPANTDLYFRVRASNAAAGTSAPSAYLLVPSTPTLGAVNSWTQHMVEVPWTPGEGQRNSYEMQVGDGAGTEIQTAAGSALSKQVDTFGGQPLLSGHFYSFR